MPNLNPFDYVTYSEELKQQYGSGREGYEPRPGTLGYNFGTTDHLLTIIDTVQTNGRNEALEIQFVPQNIPGQRIADIKDIYVVGRNNPFTHYTGGKETVSLPLEFYSDEEYHDDVKKKIDWLRSLTVKDPITGYHKVKINFGKLFRWEVFVVKSVKYNYSHFDGNSDFLPLRATCTVELQIDTDDDITINDLRT